MTLSIRERITAQVVTVLEAALTDVQVERNRDTAVGTYPSLIVYTGGQRAERLGPGIDEYNLDLVLEGFVAAEDGASGHSALNDLYARAVAALYADPTLGGLAVDVQETALAEELSNDGSQHVASFILQMDLKYQTAAGDPYSLP